MHSPSLMTQMDFCSEHEAKSTLDASFLWNKADRFE